MKNSHVVTFLILHWHRKAHRGTASHSEKTACRGYWTQKEDVESFSKADDDVRRAEELQGDINLTDSVPIQRKYTAIRRPLYEEFKQYVGDMLNLGWIQSQSQLIHLRLYVFVKRMGHIRLCIGYSRQLNSKTISDSHPLSRVQDALRSFGGSQWFSLLDQGKA